MRPRVSFTYERNKFNARSSGEDLRNISFNNRYNTSRYVSVQFLTTRSAPSRSTTLSPNFLHLRTRATSSALCRKRIQRRKKSFILRPVLPSIGMFHPLHNTRVQVCTIRYISCGSEVWRPVDISPLVIDEFHSLEKRQDFYRCQFSTLISHFRWVGDGNCIPKSHQNITPSQFQPFPNDNAS